MGISVGQTFHLGFLATLEGNSISPRSPHCLLLIQTTLFSWHFEWRVTSLGFNCPFAVWTARILPLRVCRGASHEGCFSESPPLEHSGTHWLLGVGYNWSEQFIQVV